MNIPKVSIIIPCYNVEDYIHECIESVINQNYKNLEIICVDNGSSDNTFAYLLKLKEKYPQLIIQNEEQKGAPFARNKGLSVANGKWIQFLDADDLLLPDKIAHQISMVKDNVDFIVGNAYFQNLQGKLFEWHLFSHNPWIDLFRGTFGDTCSNLWSKDLLNKLEGWDTRLSSSQEFDILFRSLKLKASFEYDKLPLTITRERLSGSISKNNIELNARKYIEKRNEVIKYLEEEKMMNEEIRQEYLSMVYSKISRLYEHNPDYSQQLYNDFFEKRISIFQLKKIRFVERWICFLFGLKGVNFIRRTISKIKQWI